MGVKILLFLADAMSVVFQSVSVSSGGSYSLDVSMRQTCEALSSVVLGCVEIKTEIQSAMLQNDVSEHSTRTTMLLHTAEHTIK